MTTVLLIVHLFVTLALIGVVLIQRSEGGGLGIGTSRRHGRRSWAGGGTTNLLTRTTAVLGDHLHGAVAGARADEPRHRWGWDGRSWLDHAGRPHPTASTPVPASPPPPRPGGPAVSTCATAPAPATAAGPATVREASLPDTPAIPATPVGTRDAAAPATSERAAESTPAPATAPSPLTHRRPAPSGRIARCPESQRPPDQFQGRRRSWRVSPMTCVTQDIRHPGVHAAPQHRYVGLPMTRFVFITGGVVSSLGKGVASAALGALMQARGFKRPPAQARPLPQRRPRHHEPLSARRGVRHR